MKNTRLSAPLLMGTALGLVGAALATQSAFATTAPPPTPCQLLNSKITDSPPGEAYALTIALRSDPNGTGAATVLGVNAQDVPANTFAPGQPPLCQVGMVVASDGNPADSQVQVAVVLPEGTIGTNSATAWNGNFLGTGNGGFAGSIATTTLVLGVVPSFVVNGTTYAVANTDLGDGPGLGGPPNYPTAWFNCDSLFCGSAEAAAVLGQTLGGLYGFPVAIADFGYLATHEMTVASKALITTFYGTPASYSFFHGCSTGGQQALMEAQRFPTDYNGILAGSPAYDRTHLHIGSAALYEATHFAPDAYMTDAALTLVHSSMLSQCAGHDGGLATDDFLTQPSKCTFTPAALVCGAPTAPGTVTCDPAAANDTCSCLTADQATAMGQDWVGALDSKGRVLYPGYDRGAEEPVALTSANSYTGNLGLNWQESGPEPAFDSLDYWAFGPTFVWTSLFASTTTPQGELFNKIKAMDNVAVGSSTFAGVLNANNTNLSAFAAAGGKLIMYVGDADPLIPTASAIDYYNGVADNDKTSASYAALYIAPGMWHCNGGPGANAFGNLSGTLPPIPTNPNDDILGALSSWVQNGGSAPPSILATKYVNDDSSGTIAFQRPLCRYPSVPYFEGHKANPLSANSYKCVARSPVTNEKFNPLYGPGYVK